MPRLADDIDVPRALADLIVAHAEYGKIGWTFARREIERRIQEMPDQQLEDLCIFFIGQTKTKVLSRDHREKFICGQVCRGDAFR